ncbi:hypothetical protein LCGC14_2596690, partial [marine sediment metagenome]
LQLSSGATANQGIRIRNDGNVGIGTTTPANLLDVAGTINGTDYNATGDISFSSGTSFWGKFIHAITAIREWTFPDRSGTVMLLEDFSGNFTDALATNMSDIEGNLNRTSNSSLHVLRSDWTTHDNYATGCTNQFVRDIDDTLTCATVDSADIASNAVKDDEVDYSAVTLSDFTNDPKYTTNNSDAIFTKLNVTDFETVNTNTTIGNFSIIQFNSSCVGFRFNNSLDAGGIFSCMP